MKSCAVLTVVFRYAEETENTSKTPFQSHPYRLANRPPLGGTERGDSLEEGGRRKHVSNASARSEAPDSSESGLSRCP